MSPISWSSRGWSRTVCWSLLLLAGWALFALSTPRSLWAQSVPPTANAAVYGLSATLANDYDTKAIASGDLNGDGALDLVMRNNSGPNRYYLNDRHGNFDAGTSFGLGKSTDAVALADMDDDGDLDIITVGEQNVLYFNDGHAHFTSQSTFGTPRIYSVVLGDIDGDHDFDVVVAGTFESDSDAGTWISEQQIWRNDGHGQLTATAAIPGWAPHLVDFDNDGDLDLVATGANNATVGLDFYRNDGTGNFTLLNDDIPSSSYGHQNDFAFGDLDGDGRLDLVISSIPNTILDGGNDEGLQLYRNHGTGNDLPSYTSQWLNKVEGASSIQLDDVDLDGDLDIVTSGLDGHPGRDDLQSLLYLNQGIDQAGDLQFARVQWGPAIASSGPTLLADLNGDGLDEIVVGGTNSDKIYTTHSDSDFGTCTPLMDGDGQILQPRTLIDLEGDGDLDLLYNKAYSSDPQLFAALNDGAGNFQYAKSLGAIVAPSDLATADLNADGLDDLMVVYSDRPAEIYLQARDGTFSLYTTLDAASTFANTLVTGDLDGDGDLDLVLGQAGYESNGQPRAVQNQIYLNQGHGSFDPALPFGAAGEYIVSLNLADLDNDGNLDIVVSNERQDMPDQSFIYWNRGNWATSGTEHFIITPLGDTPGFYYQVVVGDFDGNGFADLVGVDAQKSESIFLNHGDRTFTQQGLTTSGEQVSDLFVLDLDLDGDLDLLTGAGYALSNDGHGGFALHNVFLDVSQAHVVNLTGMRPRFVGDLNGDGLTDAIAYPTYSIAVPDVPCLNLQTRRGAYRQPAPPAQIKLLPLDKTVLDGPYASPQIFAAGAITFTYTLFDPTARPANVRGFYSLDGGGQWLPAVPTATTAETELTTLAGNQPVTHTYTWDVLGSGFFGQSDSVVFRLEALPSLHPQPNGVPGPYRLPYQAAQSSYPFRVRGSQVRVVDAAGAPMPNAQIYRRPVNDSGTAMPFAATQGGAPFSTNIQGYLSGRAALSMGDRLVALAPITATESYTLYNLSEAPTLSGSDAYTVTHAGVQTLTVSAAHPLLLFNVDVALEWDARKDTAFLNQLTFDLHRTAEFLFDATDGQATLGEIRLYQNKQNWEEADIRLYASNALIPNADPGGIVRSAASEVITANPFINATTPYSITYQPGHIRIGSIWNRFGEASGTLGEDWPRTLTHELGHYAFYLYDNYLGLQDGVVVPVTSCTGTLMSDQYREDFSEFHSINGWATDCAKTVSAQRSGRADWQTITHFYPWLSAPTGQPQTGPASLPLAVTQVEQRLAATTTLPIDIAVFDLVDVNGKAQHAGEQAQAVLYSQEKLLDLGHPVIDQLDTHGAHVGDRLCVYALDEHRLGCEVISANDNFLTLVDKPTWQPEIVVSPVSSRTVSVLVSGVAAGLTLQGKLYPENSTATPVTNFVPWAGDTYSTTFQLSVGGLAGHIQFWVDEADSASNQRREGLTSYALGGSPGKIKKPAKGNRSLVTNDQVDSESVTPAIAPDGQVLIYGNVRFSDGEFYALQKVNWLPTTPSWTTVVGNGYRVIKSARAPDLLNTSILFRYRGQDVPASEENFLSLYFWHADTQQWEQLPTVLNKAVNEASAKAKGPGLYVLMSSLQIPLRQAGWNLIAYPVQETRAVSVALASITGNYSLIYSYVVTDTADPWKLYAPDVPAWVNDLKVLEFGQGYWINATQPITWLVKGADDTLQAASVTSLPTPPATFYGTVLAGQGLTPAAGLPVQALINGVVCGEGVTQAVGEQIVYSLNVEGDGTRNPACVGNGQQVAIFVAGLPQAVAPWRNDRVQQVLLNGYRVLLPIIMR